MYLITNFTYALNAFPFPPNYVKVTNSCETIVNTCIKMHSHFDQQLPLHFMLQNAAQIKILV